MTEHKGLKAQIYLGEVDAGLSGGSYGMDGVPAEFISSQERWKPVFGLYIGGEEVDTREGSAAAGNFMKDSYNRDCESAAKEYGRVLLEKGVSEYEIRNGEQFAGVDAVYSIVLGIDTFKKTLDNILKSR